MELNEFFDYKNKLMEDLITNPEIVRLLNDKCVIDEKQNPNELIYTQIFPYEYVPDVVDDASTFICFDMDIQKTMNKTFLIPAIYIWVFTHKKFLRLQNNNGIRTDKICAEIAKTIDGSRYYGLGELNLTSIKRFSLAENFQGRVMTFQAQDFNRLSHSGKPIPSNRKHG